MKKGLFPKGKGRNIGPVNRTRLASSFSCFADRQERRPEIPVGHRPARTRRAFRKTTCSEKRANGPVNTPFPAKSRITTLALFGEVVRSTGPLARNNPFRFSTKYQDDDSGRDPFDLKRLGYIYGGVEIPKVDFAVVATGD
jgi:hypothetical protein